MKKILLTFALVLFAATAVADEAALRAQLDRIYADHVAALHKKDLEGFLAMFASDFLFKPERRTTISRSEFEESAQWEIKRTPPKKSYEIDSLRVVSHDELEVITVETIRRGDENNSAEVKHRWKETWTLTESGWKLRTRTAA